MGYLNAIRTAGIALALGAGMACGSAKAPEAAPVSAPVQVVTYTPSTNPILGTLDRLMQIPNQPRAIDEANNYLLRRKVGRALVFQLADAQGDHDGHVTPGEVCAAVGKIHENVGYAADQYVGNKDGTATQEEMDALGVRVKTRQCPGLEEAIEMGKDFGCTK